MKVWVFVEGESDRLGLDALWRDWKPGLRNEGVGLVCIPLRGKAQFFKQLGPRAAEKLVNNEEDLVVGLPDLYPNRDFDGTEYEHKDMDALATLQRSLVLRALRETYGRRGDDCASRLQRFLGAALKYDLEMLLLAAHEYLRAVLGTSEALGAWRHPVEEQNFDRPPKRVVADLFLRYSRGKRAYRETVHATDVLGRASKNIWTILVDEHGQIECPVFKRVLDWIGEKTGVPAYRAST